MAAEENKDIMNINDPLDINELAALNDDISAEFIEQLQNQIAQNSGLISDKSMENLFEEVPTRISSDANFTPQLDESIDDNFVKKYKAKIEKQKNKQFEEKQEAEKEEKKANSLQEEALPKSVIEEIPEPIPAIVPESLEDPIQITAPEPEPVQMQVQPPSAPIENLTNGNIIERPLNKDQIEYNESLDLLDDNVKYSKYVIYIDPENTEFIESLTVKERKNLINKILKEQDNIVVTQKKLNTMQTYIKHAIVAILTIAIATPVIYFTINASLEATVDNHRRSQSIFKTLYKEKGKIKKQNKY